MEINYGRRRIRRRDGSYSNVNLNPIYVLRQLRMTHDELSSYLSQPFQLEMNSFVSGILIGSIKMSKPALELK